MGEGKSGYEIRAEILEMARNIVNDDFYNRKEIWVAKHMNENGDYVYGDDEQFESPSVEEILTIANQLYKFVEQK